MIFLRTLQKRDNIVLEVLLDSGGASSIDVDLTSTVAGGRVMTLDTAAAGQDGDAFFTETNPGGAAVSTNVTYALIGGSNPPKGVWLRLAEFSHDIAGSFAHTLTVNALLDELGADVSGSAIIVAFAHISPSAAQLAEGNLFDALLPTLGLTASDSLGKRHMQPYDPSSPIGSQGIADAPVVNAFLNYDEIAGLIRAGLLTRGSGPVVDQILMPEAGKRMAGFSL
jgi:hypothetical protein|tara:strand:+ start:365 stop:1039 length:675 start_codon:yes stop_codon:yes gene_type:complete